MNENEKSKLERIISIVQNDNVSKKTIEQFLKLVLDTVKTLKSDLSNEFDLASSENIRVIKETLDIISEKHSDMLSDFNSKSTEHTNYFQEIKNKIDGAVKYLDEVKKLKLTKAKDGVDGKDYVLTEQDKEQIASLIDVPIVERVETIKEIEKEIEGSLIIDKINDLPLEEDLKIDAKHIKNLPRQDVIGGGTKFLQYLQDVKITTPTNSQVLKYNSTTKLWENNTDTTGTGDVTGPASSVNNNVVFFDGITGKLIKDSGLTLAGSNTGDQTTIVGITGTKAQFDTAVTDGNFLYVGDITQYTDEMAQDAVGGILVDSAEIDFTYTDLTPSITASIVAGSIDETKLDLSVNASLDLADTAVQPATLASYVPYTGATANLNLNTFNLITDTVTSNSILAILAGDGGTINPGQITTISGGTGGSISGAGGELQLFGGSTPADGAGGGVWISGAVNAVSSTPGYVKITGGDAGITDQDGGEVQIWGGNGNGTGLNGRVFVKSKSASSLSAVFDTSLIATTDQTFTFPDTTGTLALTSDITGTNSGTNTGDQTITNSSDATSHTVTLSASGGSVQLVEGSNITLTTTGTGSDGIVTIASTGSGSADYKYYTLVGGYI